MKKYTILGICVIAAILMAGCTQSTQSGQTPGLGNHVVSTANQHNVEYSLSGVTSGGGITYTGAPDDYTVGLGHGVINSKPLEFSGHGKKADTLLTISGKAISNGCIVKDGSTYYQFYSRWSGADIYYATSSDRINWTEQGAVLTHTKDHQYWTASVIKIGSTWYLLTFEPEVGAVYFTSSSVASGYSFADNIKDENGTAIGTTYPANSNMILDPSIFHDPDTGLYTLSVAWIKADWSERTIRFYQTDAPLKNRWTLINTDAIHSDYTWETGAIEAPNLVKGTDSNYYLFYGGGDSDDRQRIGVAVSSSLTTSFTKLGIDGMVLLDIPMRANGPMVAPRVYYENGMWYLYVSSNKADLMGYYCTDANFPLIWKPLKTSSQLYASATNYVFVDPAGDLMHTCVSPEGEYLAHPNDTAYFVLGSLTVDGSRQVTGYTDLRDYLTGVVVLPSPLSTAKLKQ